MTLSLTVWDVQHGSASHIRTPNGRDVVIDLGTGRANGYGREFSPLRHLRANYGVSYIDKLIITHPHRDHLDDIGQFDAMSPRVLERPTHLTAVDIRGGNRAIDTSIINQYLEINARYTAPLSPGQDPAIPENNGGAQIVTFHPTQCARDNLNNHSIVTFVEYANSTILVPGDNEAASWRELLQDPVFRMWLKKVDILVAPHHGREAGYCPDLFGLCSPYLVIVSDGPETDTNAADRYHRHAKGGGFPRARSTRRRNAGCSPPGATGLFTSNCPGVVRRR